MHLIRSFAAVAIILLAQLACFAGQLDNYTLTILPVAARDAVYDPTRGLLYASVPSSEGLPNGNSIVTVDPVSRTLMSHVYVGSEPNQMAISADGSRVYVGIDGARSFTWWQPADNSVGPLVPVKSYYGSPAVVESLAVSPLNPHVVVVSKNEVSTSASGDLEIFQDSASLGVPTPTNPSNSANQIGFTSDHTLISFDSADTSFAFKTWDFTGTALSFHAKINGLISSFGSRVETHDGLIYASNGLVVDPATLNALGTFSVVRNSAVESLSSPSVTYFVGPKTTSDNTLTLQVFDNHTYLKLDSKSFPQLVINGSVVELVSAGPNRLAFITSSGQFGILGLVPEPSCLVLTALGLPALAYLAARRRRDVARAPRHANR